MTSERTWSVKLGEVLRSAGFWPRTFRLVWASAPRHTVLWAFLLIVQGFLPVVMVYLLKMLVDSLAAQMRNGGIRDLEVALPTFGLLVLLAGATLAGELARSSLDWVRTAQSELVQDFIRGMVHRQAARVDLAFYESPEYHDLLEQVRGEAANRPLAFLEAAGSIVQTGITLLLMSAVLLPYGMAVPAVLLLSTTPALVIFVAFDRRFHQWWNRTTVDRRWAQYYEWLLTDSATAGEVRLFGLGEHYSVLYQTLRRRLRGERLGMMREQGVAKLCTAAAGMLISGGAMGWMFWRVLQGGAGLGDLALFYQAFNSGQGLMRALLSSVGQLYSNSLFLEHLFAFLDLHPKVIDSAEPLPPLTRVHNGVRFDHVTFRYPGSVRPALEDFSLFLPANKVVAVVGPNGGGKSTLLKLLCRFYDVDAGSIEIDGTDVRDMSLAGLRQMISVLFQFPVAYLATARENIALGDLNSAPDLERIKAAARGAGAHEVLTRLPRQYESLLGKWFTEGTQLSGGEWQRVAMARAYLRQAPLILLDEPTSFMDSWAEADWFERFQRLAAGRTGLIITHRFTIAMRADVIHVMDQGKVIESGTHLELLAREGFYARSWRTQMAAAAQAEALAR